MKHAAPKIASVSRFGLCCFFVEAQLGVTLIAILEFFYGVMSATAIISHDVRLETGGYNAKAGKFQAMVGSAAILFALVGFLGIYDKKPWMVKILAYFMAFKCVVQVCVFVLDIVALMKCEGWANTMDAQLNFSPTMYAISRKGVCNMARLSYMAGFGFDFGVHAYWTYVMFSIYKKMLANPCWTIGVLTGVDDHMSMQYLDEDLGQPAGFLDNHPMKPNETLPRHYGATPAHMAGNPTFGKP